MTEPVPDVAGPVGDAGPATLAGARNRLPTNQAVVDQELQDVVDGTNALIHERWHSPFLADADGLLTVPRVWSKNHLLGANMLASRLYTRRQSPAGIATFGELGTSYIQKSDPDVALLLGLGVHSKPGVA